MSVAEIIHEVEALSSDQRWAVLESVRHLVEPEVPGSFREAMAEIQRGEGMDLDEALKELDKT